MAIDKKEIVIIGGGIIGLCCAYFLSKNGHKIKILEKGLIGQEASLGNAGNIAPSYFLPLPSANTLKKGIKWLFIPESPLGIKFTLNLKFYVWLLKFTTYCTKKHTNNVKKILANLAMSSYELYHEFNNGNEIDFEFNNKGRLVICNTQAGFEAEQNVASMGKKLGLKSKILYPDDIKKFCKNIDLDIIGAIFYEQNANIIPKTFIQSMKKYLIKNGVKIFENCQVEKFKKNNEKINEVLTNSQEAIKADEFVLAAGAWSQKLGEDLGLNLNLQAGKGYSIVINDDKYKLDIPMTLSEGKAIVSPFGTETLFGGTLEFSGLNKSINQNKITGILKSIKNYIINFNENDIKRDEIWVGLRPCSVDGLPIIGKSKKFSNITFATGHGMMGLTLAPITGKIVNEIISNKKTTFSLDQITPNRF